MQKSKKHKNCNHKYVRIIFSFKLHTLLRLSKYFSSKEQKRQQMKQKKRGGGFSPPPPPIKTSFLYKNKKLKKLIKTFLLLKPIYIKMENKIESSRQREYRRQQTKIHLYNN